MYITIEILTAPINRNSCDIDGYDSVNYEYEVEEKDLKEAIVEACMAHFKFNNNDYKSLYNFIETFDMWEELEEEFEYYIKDCLMETCYDKAEKEYNELHNLA